MKYGGFRFLGAMLVLAVSSVLFSDVANAQKVDNGPAKTDVLFPAPVKQKKTVEENSKAVVVQLNGEISTPQIYIIERAVEFANSNKADVLLIDMDTPGGELGTTLEIMKRISEFKGRSICYVDTDAASAGSIIACACDEIWFSPKGVMGAAEAVTSGGKDIDSSMKRKVESFLSAKVRAFSEGKSRRAQLQRAMGDPDGNLVSKSGKLIKRDGELLTLTAQEAVEEIDGGPMLADGIANNIDVVLEISFGTKNFTKETVEQTWAESLSKYITQWSPILLGIGFLLLFIEFKTPNFGIIGGLGIACLLVVFLGAHLAGIAGYEELIVFAIGLILIFAELLFFPGTIILAAVGALCVFGSIVWALAVVFPDVDFYSNLSALAYASLRVLAGIAIALVLLALLWRFLPNTNLWNKMILGSSKDSEQIQFSAVMDADKKFACLVGKIGLTYTQLMPSGKVSVEGKIYDASTDGEHMESGQKVTIVGFDPFGLKVKKADLLAR